MLAAGPSFSTGVRLSQEPQSQHGSPHQHSWCVALPGTLMDLVFSTCSPSAWNPHLELGWELRFAYHLENLKKNVQIAYTTFIQRALKIYNERNMRFTS